jgi:hypothetical protein
MPVCLESWLIRVIGRANTAGKANKKARALSSSQLAPSAGLESDGGRTPLDMVPVLIKSRTRQ